MTTPTMAELQAQRTEIENQIALASITPLQLALTALGTTESLIAELQAVAADLPQGNAKTQIGNVITVLTTVPVVIADDLARAQGTTVSTEALQPPIA